MLHQWYRRGFDGALEDHTYKNFQYALSLGHSDHLNIPRSDLLSLVGSCVPKRMTRKLIIYLIAFVGVG